MGSLLSGDDSVSMLQKYIADGTHDVSMIAGLVRDVIEGGWWSGFTDELGMRVEHPSFQSFVTTPRWRGLGVSRDALVGWVREHDADAAGLIEKTWNKEVPAAKSEKGRTPDNARATGISTHDDTADSILSRLKRDDPDMAQQVVNGELSANAAARIKGWRKPRILVTSPTSVAHRLREHFTADELADLIKELQS